MIFVAVYISILELWIFMKDTYFGTTFFFQ